MGEALPGTTSNFEISISVAATLESIPPPVFGRKTWVLRSTATADPCNRSHANGRPRFSSPKHLVLGPTQETLFMDIWVQDVVRRVVDSEGHPLNVAFRRSNVGNKPAHGLTLLSRGNPLYPARCCECIKFS